MLKGQSPGVFEDYYIPEPNTGCWLWIGAALPTGYGRYRKNYIQYGAHRYAYERQYGPIPAGLTLDHKCRVPSCVNPAHLEAVSIRVNILRSDGPAAVNSKRTHCKHGHEFTPENTYRAPGSPSKRDCLTCNGIRNEAERVKRLAARQAR